MDLEVLTRQEYRKRLRSEYWKKDLDESPDMMGIAHYPSQKAYVLIDTLAECLDDKTLKGLINEISSTSIHELLHLTCGIKVKEEKIQELENLLMSSIKLNWTKIVVILP